MTIHRLAPRAQNDDTRDSRLEHLGVTSSPVIPFKPNIVLPTTPRRNPDPFGLGAVQHDYQPSGQRQPRRTPRNLARMASFVPTKPTRLQRLAAWWHAFEFRMRALRYRVGL